eukprot:jgi/Botrbrau1/7436/Bobra.0083s0009.1
MRPPREQVSTDHVSEEQVTRNHVERLIACKHLIRTCQGICTGKQVLSPPWRLVSCSPDSQYGSLTTFHCNKRMFGPILIRSRMRSLLDAFVQ